MQKKLEKSGKFVSPKKWEPCHHPPMYKVSTLCANRKKIEKKISEILSQKISQKTFQKIIRIKYHKNSQEKYHKNYHYYFWLIWCINQRALYNHELSVVRRWCWCRCLCTPPPGTGLDIETSYLVQICTSNI